MVRLARRGRSTILRILYIVALFIGLAWAVETQSHRESWRPNELAHAAESFAYTLFMVQNMAVLFLVPAYLGSAIAEEKERRTLEMLFTTQLNDTEIILGKFSSRIIHLVGFVLAGCPILGLIQFWGGVDTLLVVGNVVNTLLNILTLGSFCLMMSVMCRTVTAAVVISYAFVLSPGICCAASLRGFPFVLEDARSGVTHGVTVQDLGLVCMPHLVADGDLPWRGGDGAARQQHLRPGARADAPVGGSRAAASSDGLAGTGASECARGSERGRNEHPPTEAAHGGGAGGRVHVAVCAAAGERSGADVERALRRWTTAVILANPARADAAIPGDRGDLDDLLVRGRSGAATRRP